MIRKFSDIIIRLLFSTRCINCAREGKILCEDCLSLISLLDINCCPNCGSDKVSMPGKFCHLCQKKLSLDGVISAVNYQDPIVKKAIFLFKSPPFIKELAKPLSSLIVSQLKLQDNNFDGFILSYIPLDKSSLYHRGFNQSKLLAYELGKSLNLPTYELLKKTRETKPQKSLNKEERKENVKNAFEILENMKEFVQNKKIIIVDDIYTTGATLNEAARVLKEGGAKEVWGITVAREF